MAVKTRKNLKGKKPRISVSFDWPTYNKIISRARKDGRFPAEWLRRIAENAVQ